jgi:hypothetical protein
MARSKLQEMESDKLLERYATNMAKLQTQLSFVNFSQPPVTVTSEEAKPNSKKCSFVGASCPMETLEHDLVRRFFTKDDVVLELGGRFGTTSCAIASQQHNSGKLVVVEPDRNVWNLLNLNRIVHQCNFLLYRGVVASESMVLESASYDTRTIKKTRQSTVNANTSLEATPFHKLEDMLGWNFTALLIDCEGCIEPLFKTYVANNQLAAVLKNVRVIVLEADMSDQSPSCFAACVDYKKWIDLLATIGFGVVHFEFDRQFADIIHYVLDRSGQP